MEQWTYLLVLLGSLFVPLLRSFEHRINFKRYWGALFAGIGVMMLVFIPWDIVFTRNAIWSFAPDRVLGFYLLDLPIEEWLFFIVIPYCVVFIYEVVKLFFPDISFQQVAKFLALMLGALLIIIGIEHYNRVYTVVVMLTTGILLIVQPFLGSHKTWLSHFIIAFLISLIPFGIVNGILTGVPVVSYNDLHNLGIRLGTIPIEDSIFFLGMMLIIMPVYERLKPDSCNRKS